MHKSLRAFTMEGQVNDDKDFARLRAQFESELVSQMRETGYVPVLGMGPFWSTVYDAPKDWYEFVLTVHGYRVGRKQACELEGITAEGKLIPRNTPPSKSKPSSTNAP